jgi:hypothetical protein
MANTGGPVDFLLAAPRGAVICFDKSDVHLPQRYKKVLTRFIFIVCYFHRAFGRFVTRRKKNPTIFSPPPPLDLFARFCYCIFGRFVAIKVQKRDKKIVEISPTAAKKMLLTTHAPCNDLCDLRHEGASCLPNTSGLRAFCVCVFVCD